MDKCKALIIHPTDSTRAINFKMWLIFGKKYTYRLQDRLNSLISGAKKDLQATIEHAEWFDPSELQREIIVVGNVLRHLPLTLSLSRLNVSFMDTEVSAQRFSESLEKIKNLIPTEKYCDHLPSETFYNKQKFQKEQNKLRARFHSRKR